MLCIFPIQFPSSASTSMTTWLFSYDLMSVSLKIFKVNDIYYSTILCLFMESTSVQKGVSHIILRRATRRNKHSYAEA